MARDLAAYFLVHDFWRPYTGKNKEKGCISHYDLNSNKNS